MAYNITNWKDHVVSPDKTFILTTNPNGTVTLTPSGTVIEQGTNMSAANFNNAERGVFGAYMTANEAVRVARELQRKTGGLIGEAISTVLASSQKFPFNNSQKTVPLAFPRNDTGYTVFVEVLSSSGGGIGDIVVSDKLLNGFKIAYTGAATSVSLRLLVQGGI